MIRSRSFIGLLLLSLSGLITACAQSTTKKAYAAPPQKGGAAAKPTLRFKKNRVVARFQGGRITYGQLHAKNKTSFRKLHDKYLVDLYRLEQQHLEEMMAEVLIAAEAKKAKLSQDQYLMKIAQNPKATKEEIQGFYDQNLKESGQPLALLQGEIERYLVEMKKQEALQKEIERLKKSSTVQIDLPAPATTKASFDLTGRPMKGKASAPITLVEFSDFECPFCSRAAATLDEIVKAYPNDVKVYFMHFPLGMHQNAVPAAIASQCANLQGKFWEMHDQLFKNQHNLSLDALPGIARAAGLDIDKWKTCLQDPRMAKYVSSDKQQGNAAGVEGTPTFFINGIRYPLGVPSVDAIKKLVK